VAESARRVNALKETGPVAGYTIVNLKEVEDQAPKFGFSPNLEARFATAPLELEKSGISYQRLAPNFRVPFGHKQKDQEELYVMLSGSGRVKLDDEVVALKTWDALRVPAEIMRCFEAGPEGAEILAFGAPNTGSSPAGDAEMTPNWWTD
jgi:mannose-6-phosphate isomerase-like protein (cupin superfamily)